MQASLAFTAIVAIILAGCGGPESPQLPEAWRGRDLREPGWTNTTLEREWSLVLEYPLGSGAVLDWDFVTEAEGRQLYFQVVHMEGTRSSRMVGKHVSEDLGSVTTPTSGVYQVIWMNDGFFPVSFNWAARDGYSIKTYPPNEGPGCLALGYAIC
ncbi:MAG: hypothetical protein ACYC2H_00340 [Thermoplasmatota archaeon]